MSAKKKGNPAEGFGFDLPLPKPPARTPVAEAEAARFTGDAPAARPVPAESASSRPSEAAPPPSKAVRESAPQAVTVERAGTENLDPPATGKGGENLHPPAPSSPAVAIEPSRPALVATPENQGSLLAGGGIRHAVTPGTPRAVPTPLGDKPTGRKVRVRKTDGVPMRRTTVWLKSDMAKRLAVFCALNEVSQTDIIDAALADYFERHDSLAA